MPIEPIDNPYRVIKFQKTRRVRRAQEQDPEEKSKNRHDQEELPSEEKEHEDTYEATETTHEPETKKKLDIKEVKILKTDDPDDEPESKIDIKI